MFLKELGEFGLIDLFKNGWPPETADVIKGIGDDCAVLDPGGDRLLLVTTDMLVENIHFSTKDFSPYDLGVRSIAVNLSDIAAMGSTRTFSFLSFGAPPGMEVAFAESFMDGFRECSLRYDSLLLGGDTVSSDRMVINVCLLGMIERERVLYRGGAKVGDRIYVSGFLGDSAAGLELIKNPRTTLGPRDRDYLLARHRTPEPRIGMGRLLSQSGYVHACIDLSDGIASDLGHICRESGLGARVHAESIPISRACRMLAQERTVDPLTWSLFGGEDFELLFTASPEMGRSLQAGAKAELGLVVTEVGEMISGQGVRLVRRDQEEDITSKGYNHFR
ncbi:MAG: thiamine-phosphate kinase [Deltaproteobacteria bacterium]|nr:thiamine-phosphate kinase [Deltaproteobacteria bacterium]